MPGAPEPGSPRTGIRPWGGELDLSGAERVSSAAAEDLAIHEAKCRNYPPPASGSTIPLRSRQIKQEHENSCADIRTDACIRERLVRIRKQLNFYILWFVLRSTDVYPHPEKEDHFFQKLQSQVEGFSSFCQGSSGHSL